MPLTAAIIRSCAVKAHLTMAGWRTDLLHRPAAKPAKHPSLKLRQSARPGRNVTGFTNFEYATGGKWLELLKEAGRRAISRPARFARAP